MLAAEAVTSLDRNWIDQWNDVVLRYEANGRFFWKPFVLMNSKKTYLLPQQSLCSMSSQVKGQPVPTVVRRRFSRASSVQTRSWCGLEDSLHQSWAWVSMPYRKKTPYVVWSFLTVARTDTHTSPAASHIVGLKIWAYSSVSYLLWPERKK